jgi:hypothetical protein
VLAVFVQPHVTAGGVLAELDGTPNSRIFKKRLSALLIQSDNICTVVAGTASAPRPLKRLFRSYFERNVPSASYCAFSSANISL